MEAVNGGSLGEDKGGPPPPSPLTGCYLLVVVGEPHSGEHKEIILQRVAKGMLSWNATNCLVDLEKELSTITDQGLEGEEARYGERLIQFASENLVTEILIHPAASTLSQCVRNLLSSFTRHRHIIHAGFTFQGNGSWALQDGTFSYSDFCEAFQEIEVQRVIHAYENGISIDLHCSPEGDWTRIPKESFAKACKVRVNPTDVLSTGSSSISNFIKYLAPFLVPTSLENILESSDVVGNIRFSRPTLYVFPGGQGDAALFGINGFNMLLDGGYSRKACFWDFVRHLDRLDAVLMTRLNNSNLCGISSVLKRKRQGAVYPQVGHFFCNIQERKSLPSPDGDKDRDPLIFSILDEGQGIVQDLQYLNLIPQSCYRDTDPIILYHKVGHGTLNMYVLSPDKNSREVREFLQKWNQSDPKLFAGSRGGRDFSFPLQNLVSICALLVWQPANPNDTITRILYPGSTPQKKIFDGLDRLKSLECIKHPLCSEKSLAPVKKSKQEVIEKLSSKDKVISEKRTENKLIEDAMKNGDMNGDVVREKQVKKSDSLESDKEKKTKRVEEGKKADKIEDVEKIVENGEKAKPKVKSGDAKPIKKRGDSQHRKKPAPDKKGPTTPKKTVENKTNGDIKEKKAAQKPSPSATPAKSTKDANNRRVVENKKTLPKKEAAAPKPIPSADAKPKPERKPISRRPKTIKGPPSPMKKMTNGVQKPDSISKRGKLDKEGTTDSSTVSTPSADQESVLKKDLSKLTPDEIQQLKDKELDELKEEQEAVKEIEAVFRKGEGHDEEAEPGVRKIKEVSIDDNLEVEEYLIIEKEEIEHDSLDQEIKEDEMQKLARDSEESEKQRKLSSEEKEIDLQKEEEAKELSSQEILSKDDIPEKVIDDAESKKPQVSSPEDKVTPTTDKKDLGDEEVKEVVESHPEEKVSANVESGATTTAPTLPEDERITLDDIKEDNGQPVEEKHVKEETKEKEVPIIQLPPQSQQDSHPKMPLNVEIALDKQKHIRDIVKTPDEVADLPVHEEADYHEFHGDGKKNHETDISKEQDKKIEEKKEDSETVDKSKEEVIKVEEQLQKEVLKEIKDGDNMKETTDKKGDTDVPDAKKDVVHELLLTQDAVKDIAKDVKTESKAFLEEEISANDGARQETLNATLTGVSDVEKSLETDKNIPEEGIIKTDKTQKIEILEKAELETKEKVEIESDILKEKLKESIDDEWVVITKEDEEEKDIVETAQEADASIEKKKEIMKETSGDDIIVKVVTDPISKNIDDEIDKQQQTEKLHLEKENKNVAEKVPVQEFEIARKDEHVEESKITKKDVDKATKLQKEDKELTKEKDVECECELDDHEIHKEDEIQDVLEKDTEDIKALIEEADKNTLTDKNVKDMKELRDDSENIIKTPTITDKKVDNIKETKDTVELIEDEGQELKKEVVDSEEELNLIRMKRDLSKIEEPLYTDLKQEGEQLAKIDDKLQELKRVTEDLSMESEEFQIEKSTKSPEHAEQVTLPDSSPEDDDHVTFGELDIDKTELGRKSPAEREEDVKKIVVSVAEVLKSEAPLEVLQGKLPFTQELRETHITTQDSPILEAKVIINDDIPPIPEEPAAEELTDVTDRRKDLIADAQQLMAASSKVISDIKSKADENVDKKEEITETAEKQDDKIEVKVEKANDEDNKTKEIIKAEEKTEVKDNKTQDKDNKTEAKDNKIEAKDIKTEDKAEAKDDKTEEKDQKVDDIHNKAEDKTEVIDTKTEDKDNKTESKDDKTAEKHEKAEDEDDKADDHDDKAEDKDDDSGTVHRMLVTASSEDGGEEIEICPPGTITFSKSSESSGRSSPEPSQKTPSQKSSIVETLSDTLTTVKQITEKDLDIEKQDDNKDLEGEGSVEKSSVLDSIKDAFDSAKEIVQEKIDLMKGTTEAQPIIQETESIVPDTISSAETIVMDAKDEVKAEIKKVEEELQTTEHIKEIKSDVIKKVDQNTAEVREVISSQTEKLSEKPQDGSEKVRVEKGDEKVVAELTSIKSSNADDLNKLVSDSKDIEKSKEDKVKETVKEIENVTDTPIKAMEELTHPIINEDDLDAEKTVESKSKDAVNTEIVSEKLKDSLADKVEHKVKEVNGIAVEKAKEVITDISDADAARESVENKIDDGLKISEEGKGSIKKEIEAVEHLGKTEIVDGEKLDNDFKDGLSKTEDTIENKVATTAISKDLKDTAKSTDLESEKCVVISESGISTKAGEKISEPKTILSHVEECAKQVEETVEKKGNEVKYEISSKIDATVTEVLDDVARVGHELGDKIQNKEELVSGKIDNLLTKAEEVQGVIKEVVDEKVQEIKEEITDTNRIIAKQTEEVVDKTEKISKEIKDEVKEDQKVAEEAILETKKDVSEKVSDMSATVLDITDKIEETIGIKAEHYTEATADKLDRKVTDGKDKVEDEPVKEQSVEKPHDFISTSAHEIDEYLNGAKDGLKSTKEVSEKMVESKDTKINYSDVDSKVVAPERKDSVIENVIDTAKSSLISEAVTAETIGDKSEDLKPSDTTSAEENSTDADTANRRDSLLEKAEDILVKSEKAIESVFSAIGGAASSVLHEILPEHKNISSEIKSVENDDQKLAEDLNESKNLETSPALSEKYMPDITEGHLTKERDSGAAQSLQTKLVSNKVAEDTLISSSVLEMDRATNDVIDSKLKNIEEKVSDIKTISEHKIDQTCDIVKDGLQSIEGKVASDIKDNVIKTENAGVEKVHDSLQKSDIHDISKKGMISEEMASETKGVKSADLKSSDTQSADEVKAKGQTEQPTQDSFVEKAEDILEKSEKAIQSVFSDIGDAAKSVFNEILSDQKGSASEIKPDEEHAKHEDKHDTESMKEAPPSSGKSSPADKTCEETKPIQVTSDIIIDEPRMMTTGKLEFEGKREDKSKVNGDQGSELTKGDTNESEKISVDESTGKHGGVLEVAEKFIEESEKAVESVFSTIGGAARSILHDIIPEDKDNKASEKNEKSVDQKDVEKEKTDEVKKEDLQKEEKYLADNFTEIADAKIRAKPSDSLTSDGNNIGKDVVEQIETKTEGQGTSDGQLPKSVIFEKCKSSDGFKKEVIEEAENKVDEWNPKELKKDPRKSIASTERNFDEIESKLVPKQIETSEKTVETVSDMTKSMVTEKDEDATKMEQTESGPSSIIVIDSNKLQDNRHSTDDKSEKEKLVNEQQEKKDPEKEHDTLEEKVEEKSRELKTIQSEFKENIKPVQEFKKEDAKSEQPAADSLKYDMTKSVYVSESSHESHKLDDRISESSKPDKTGDVHKEGDPSLNAKDSVVLDDQPMSSQTEKCEKESMEKTTSEKDSDNLNVEYTERKKLSISDVEISIKTDECPQDASQIFLDNERAILRDNIDAKMYVQPIVSQGDELAGSSTISQVTAAARSDKSSPELEISDKTTPPTVPVSPIVKEIKSPSSKLESGLSEQTETDDEDLSTKSQIAHSQSDLDELDMKMDSMSTSFYGALPEEHADGEEVPATLLYEITKAKYTTELKQEGGGHERKEGEVDLMTASFIGQLPSASKSTDSKEDGIKNDPVDSWGKPLSLPAPTYLYEVTKAKFTSSTEDLMTCSFIGDTLPSSSSKDRSQEKAETSADPMTTSVYFERSSDSGYDPIASWGKPLGLPSPAPPNNDKGTPKKERKLPAYVTAKNKLNDDKKRAESPSKLRAKKSNPVYVDLTYVPHHGNHYYSYVDFFKKIRARYYVFSGLEPSRQVYDALLEAKQTWEDKELEVTIIPTYDTDILGYWVAENEELLSKFKIDLSPSASRCTINLQDHETSCSAYRLEF